MPGLPQSRPGVSYRVKTVGAATRLTAQRLPHVCAACEHTAGNSPQPLIWADTPRKIAPMPSRCTISLGVHSVRAAAACSSGRRRLWGGGADPALVWHIYSEAHLAVLIMETSPAPAICIRVLTVSTGNITQCSAIPARAPAIMYLRVSRIRSVRDP